MNLFKKVNPFKEENVICLLVLCLNIMLKVFPDFSSIIFFGANLIVYKISSILMRF